MDISPDATLEGHWEPVLERDHFTCALCGFDGRTFDNWMQISADHVRPKSSGGADSLDNLVTCCNMCNSITSRMAFAPTETRQQILEKKRAYVALRRQEYYDRWLKTVAPLYLRRPLPPLP